MWKFELGDRFCTTIRFLEVFSCPNACKLRSLAQTPWKNPYAEQNYKIAE